MRGHGRVGLHVGLAGRVPAASAVRWPAARFFFWVRRLFIPCLVVPRLVTVCSGLSGDRSPRRGVSLGGGRPLHSAMCASNPRPARGLCVGSRDPCWPPRSVRHMARPCDLRHSDYGRRRHRRRAKGGRGGDTCVACARARRRPSPRPGRGRVGPRRPTQRSARGGWPRQAARLAPPSKRRGRGAHRGGAPRLPQGCTTVGTVYARAGRQSRSAPVKKETTPSDEIRGPQRTHTHARKKKKRGAARGGRRLRQSHGRGYGCSPPSAARPSAPGLWVARRRGGGGDVVGVDGAAGD